MKQDRTGKVQGKGCQNVDGVARESPTEKVMFE